MCELRPGLVSGQISTKLASAAHDGVRGAGTAKPYELLGQKERKMKVLPVVAAAAIAFAPFLLVAPRVANAAPCFNGTYDPAVQGSQACMDCYAAHGGQTARFCMGLGDPGPAPRIAGTPGDECSRYSAPNEAAAHDTCELAISKGGHFDH